MTLIVLPISYLLMFLLTRRLAMWDALGSWPVPFNLGSSSMPASVGIQEEIMTSFESKRQRILSVHKSHGLVGNRRRPTR